MNRSKNFIIGIGIISIAILLLLSQLNILSGISILHNITLFQLSLGILALIVFINGIFKIRFGQIFFSTAFFIIIFDNQLGLTDITPWTVLAASLLLTIGMNILFPRHKYKFKNKINCHSFSNNVGNLEGDDLFFKTSFGDATKYIKSTDFKYGCFICNFGDLNIYFTDAQIPGDSATIDLNVKFGDMDIFIPKNWKIESHINNTFGDVGIVGDHIPDENTKTIIISGDVSFGDLKILYI